jgi:hydrogenase maturation protease
MNEARRRVLVAGIGNIFLGDDGFGVEVVRRLRGEALGDLVDVADFGIRGIHLAYELAEGIYHSAILVDAVSRGGAPGTLYVIDPAADDQLVADSHVVDAHTLTPGSVLAWLRKTGGSCRVIVVGCEPDSLEETMGLSAVVAASVPSAIEMVRDRVAALVEAAPCA